MRDLQDLGRHMAALQDGQLSVLQEDAGPVSPMTGASLLRRAGQRRRTRRLVQSCATLLLLAGAIAGVRLWQRPSDGGVAQLPARSGQRLEATLHDVGLTFDDGSRALLSQGACVRTEMLGPTSARLVLERGRVNVRVLHTPTTDWTVRAGDYAVRVTGTRFSVDWQPESQAFRLNVTEGSVRVSGGILAGEIDVPAGQKLVLDPGHAGTTPAAAAPLPAPQTREPDLAPVLPVERKPSETNKQPPARHIATSPWQVQAEAGHYREALAEAERKGFESICRESSGADLLNLAEIARYAGRLDRAEQALRAVRARFSRGENASTAAYLLGRMAAEARRDHKDAARWFRTYLDEQPDGRLTREAEGRLLESLAFMDRDTARAAARAYLEHYPRGPHAAFARNLLGP